MMTASAPNPLAGGPDVPDPTSVPRQRTDSATFLGEARRRFHQAQRWMHRVFFPDHSPRVSTVRLQDFDFDANSIPRIGDERGRK